MLMFDSAAWAITGLQLFVPGTVSSQFPQIFLLQCQSVRWYGLADFAALLELKILKDASFHFPPVGFCEVQIVYLELAKSAGHFEKCIPKPEERSGGGGGTKHNFNQIFVHISLCTARWAREGGGRTRKREKNAAQKRARLWGGGGEREEAAAASIPRVGGKKLAGKSKRKSKLVSLVAGAWSVAGRVADLRRPQSGAQKLLATRKTTQST